MTGTRPKGVAVSLGVAQAPVRLLPGIQLLGGAGRAERLGHSEKGQKDLGSFFGVEGYPPAPSKLPLG